MQITIEKNIIATIDEVWNAFNNPDDILQWDYTDEWKTTWVSNDLKVGGQLLLFIEIVKIVKVLTFLQPILKSNVID